MSDVTFNFSELSDFAQETLTLAQTTYPTEAKALMTKAGNKLRAEIRGAYPKTRKSKKTKGKSSRNNLRTGLRRGKPYKYNGDEYQIRVSNRAYHAWLYEHGHRIIGHRPGLKDTGKRAEGKHIVGNTAKGFTGTFNDLVEAWADKILEEGFK